MEEKFPGNINTEKHQKNSLLSTAHILLSANYMMTAPSGSQGNRELLGALGSEDCKTTTTKKHNLISAKCRIHEKESEKVEKHPDWKREISTYFFYYYKLLLFHEVHFCLKIAGASRGGQRYK